MRISVLSLSLVLAATTTHVHAQCTHATPPTLAGKVIEIDASTGVITSATAYKKTDAVRVLIKNKNPFRYDYRVTVETQVVEEPGLARFIEVAQLGPPASTEPPGDAAMGTGTPCTDAQIGTVRGLYQRLDTTPGIASDANSLKTDVMNAVSAHNQFATTLAGHQKTLQNDEKALVLCNAAESLIALVEGYKPTTAGLVDRADALLGFAATLRGAAQALTGTCTHDLLTQGRERAFFITNSLVPELKDKIKKIADAKTAADTAAADVKKILASADAFYEIRHLGPFDLPTNAAVKIERKERTSTAGFSTLQTARINFGGGQKFIFAGGIASSLLDRERFSRIQGFELDRAGNRVLVDGQPVLTSVVGRSEESSGGVSPVFLLHGSIGGPWSVVDSFGLSLGITAHVDDRIDLEYIAGPSFGFVDNRFILVIGAYRAQQHELAGDFHVGAKVPDDVTEIPITRRGDWGIGFALAVKIN
jgi:hypothetical protein